MPGTVGAIRAGRAFIEVFADTSSLSRGLKLAKNQITDFGKNIGFIGLGIATLGGAVAGPLLAAVKSFGDAGDNLHEMSKRTGVSVEALSELGYAAEQTGSDIQAVDRNLYLMGGFLNRAANSSKAATLVLHSLGLTIQDFLDLKPEERFLLIAHALDRISDPNYKADLARQIFGRGARNILTLLADGATSIEEMRKKFRGLGLTISSTDAAAADNFHDMLNDLGHVVKRFTFSIGAGIAPAITDLGQAFISVTGAAQKWIDKNRDLFKSLFTISAAVIALGASLIVLGIAIFAIGKVLGIVAAGFSLLVTAIKITVAVVTTAVGFFASLIVGNLGLLVVAIGATALAWYYAKDDIFKVIKWIGDKFTEFYGRVKEVMGAIVDALVAGDVKGAAEVLWKGLVVAWDNGVVEVQKIWHSLWREMFTFAIGAWNGFLVALTEVWSSLKQGFAEVIYWIEKKWEGLKKSFEDFDRGLTLQESLHQIDEMEKSGKIAKGYAEDLRNALYENAINEQHAAEDAHKSVLAQIENDRKTEVGRIRSEMKSALDAMEADMEKQIAAMNTELETASGERKAALVEAQKALQEKLNSIKAAKTFRELTSAPYAEVSSPFDNLINRIKGLPSQFGSRSGNFSTQVASDVFNPLGLQANTGEQMIDLLGEIRDNTAHLEDGPLGNYD